MWWSPGQMCFLTRVQAHTNIWRSSMNVFLTVSINTHVDTFTNTHTHITNIDILLLFYLSLLSFLFSYHPYFSLLVSSHLLSFFISSVLFSSLFCFFLLFCLLLSSHPFVLSFLLYHQFFSSSVLIVVLVFISLSCILPRSLARSLSTPPVGVVLLG